MLNEQKDEKGNAVSVYVDGYPGRCLCCGSKQAVRHASIAAHNEQVGHLLSMVEQSELLRGGRCVAERMYVLFYVLFAVSRGIFAYEGE